MGRKAVVLTCANVYERNWSTSTLVVNETKERQAVECGRTIRARVVVLEGQCRSEAWGVALILPAATHEPATNAVSC